MSAHFILPLLLMAPLTLELWLFITEQIVVFKCLQSYLET